MLTYRTFRNADPPALAALWRSREGQPGLYQPISSELLDQLVFAKRYFDYAGLILAHDDGRLVGFAHAGFGPNADETDLSTDCGTTCLLLTAPGPAEAAVAAGLLEQCENYLRRRGAKVLCGGGLHPLCPFYLGLYGGSEMPGILDSDAIARQAFAARGYEEVERAIVWGRSLEGFEALIDRRQMQARRQMLVEVAVDAPTQTWWEAVTLGEFDLTRFDLVPRTGGKPVATAVFRGLEPAGTTAVGRAAGLLSLSVDLAYRRRGLALFLVNEAFRQFIRQGIMRVEVQTRESDAVATSMFPKLGFQETGRGGEWRKNEKISG
jgi:ribosomal protein S18 acetylase RimI-like enzyme